MKKTKLSERSETRRQVVEVVDFTWTGNKNKAQNGEIMQIDVVVFTISFFLSLSLILYPYQQQYKWEPSTMFVVVAILSLNW